MLATTRYIGRTVRLPRRLRVPLWRAAALSTVNRSGAVCGPDAHRREGTLATATEVKIKPLEDRVLVTVDDQEQTTSSGLVIPDTAQEKPPPGTVGAVGPGKR